MSYAILRVAKIKTAQQASAKTAHNYRLRETPNADAERQALNREYVNTAERGYWELATERIAAVGAKVRPDSVRGVEIILTASPEAFQRDAQGIALDQREGAWAKANVAFLQDKFGKENVVAITLHQDELTPHFQAVVVPLTADGRLSAKDLFNPRTLRQLQTDYAEAMQPFGLERGVQHSRAKHEVMRRVYGAQQRSQEEMSELTKSEPVTGLRIEGPSGLELVNLSKWRAEQEARLNAELSRQLNQANARAEKAAKIAQDSSTAKDRVQTLRRQLANVEATKTGALADWANAATDLTRVAVCAAQGEALPAHVLTHGQQVRAGIQIELEAHVQQALKAPIRKMEDLTAQLQRLSEYEYTQDSSAKRRDLQHTATGSRFELAELKPGGMSMRQAFDQAVQRTVKRDQVQSKGRNRGASDLGRSR